VESPTGKSLFCSLEALIVRRSTSLTLVSVSYLQADEGYIGGFGAACRSSDDQARACVGASKKMGQ